jgi:uncharacterized protein YjdB
MYETGDVVIGVKLDKTSLSLTVGERTSLAATVEPPAAANLFAGDSGMDY